MKTRTFQIIVFSISAIFAFLSLYFGEEIWSSRYITNPKLQSSIIVITPVLFLFLGFLFSFFSIMVESQDKIIELKKELISEIKHNLSNLSDFSIYTGTQALIHIAEKLKHTESALNTKIMGSGFSQEKFYASGAEIFPKSLIDAVKNGMQLKEIASNYGIDIAKDIKKRIEQIPKRTGKYEGRKINLELNSMINFIILHFKDGSHEVWFGWLTYENDVNQTTYRSTDNRLIQFFEAWFDELFRKGLPLEDNQEAKSINK